MTNMPHVDCQIKEVCLKTERDNQVKIAIRMNEDANVETGEGTIVYILNPVMFDGQWYLTIYDTYAEGVGEFN